MKAIVHAPKKNFAIQLAQIEEADEKLESMGFEVVEIVRRAGNYHITVKGVKHEQERKASRPNVLG